MGDPYWRYGSSADRVSLPITSFPGHMSSEPTTLSYHNPWSSNDLHINPLDYAQKDILPSRSGPYGLDDGIGIRRDPKFGGLTAEVSVRGYPAPIRESILMGLKRPNVATPELINERPASLPKAGGLPAATRESNVLFVDGLPTDCSRREVGHLFRPFIGFKDIRVVHKEPRRSGDKAMVLCFVEFDDAKCALTAMEALQGYKFDDKKPESPELRVQFAHFPFRLPSTSENGEPPITG